MADIRLITFFWLRHTKLGLHTISTTYNSLAASRHCGRQRFGMKDNQTKPHPSTSPPPPLKEMKPVDQQFKTS